MPGPLGEVGSAVGASSLPQGEAADEPKGEQDDGQEDAQEGEGVLQNPNSVERGGLGSGPRACCPTGPRRPGPAQCRVCKGSLRAAGATTPPASRASASSAPCRGAGRQLLRAAARRARRRKNHWKATACKAKMLSCHVTHHNFIQKKQRYFTKILASLKQQD